MLDEKLLKALILFNAEAESRSCNPMTALMNRNPFKKTNTRNNKKKTDIFLNCLSENELNDLVSVVTLGNYDTHRRNDEKWNKTKKELIFGDYSTLRKKLSLKAMTSKDCIAYLRKWSPGTVADNIRTYMKIEPMTTRQRNLLKRAGEHRISAMMHTNKIEVR